MRADVRIDVCYCPERNAVLANIIFTDDNLAHLDVLERRKIIMVALMRRPDYVCRVFSRATGHCRVVFLEPKEPAELEAFLNDVLSGLGLTIDTYHRRVTAGEYLNALQW